MENALRAGVMQHGKIFISPIFLTFFLKLELSWKGGCWGERGGRENGDSSFLGFLFQKHDMDTTILEMI